MHVDKKKGITLYNRRMAWHMISLMALINATVIGFCCYVYFVKLSPTNLAVILLLLALLAMIDFCCIYNYACTRFLIRCQIDHSGIHCSLLGLQRWTLKWNDIRVYGGMGGDLIHLLFFSTDASEQNQLKTVVGINKHRIVFENRDEFWSVAGEYIPEDIKKRLLEFDATKQSCFYRR